SAPFRNHVQRTLDSSSAISPKTSLETEDRVTIGQAVSDLACQIADRIVEERGFARTLAEKLVAKRKRERAYAKAHGYPIEPEITLDEALSLVAEEARNSVFDEAL